ncbi:hypothetical protein H4F76_25245, partial [Enterobacter hormaechei]|nr:hypothetical protein [Enterobacter hormaechei]
VIPVLVIDRTEDAVPLGRALVDGGLKVLEITLRTPNALDVIREIANHVEGAVVAAGTVTTPAQWEAAAEAGAQRVPRVRHVRQPRAQEQEQWDEGEHRRG